MELLSLHLCELNVLSCQHYVVSCQWLLFKSIFIYMFFSWIRYMFIIILLSHYFSSMCCANFLSFSNLVSNHHSTIHLFFTFVTSLLYNLIITPLKLPNIKREYLPWNDHFTCSRMLLICVTCLFTHISRRWFWKEGRSRWEAYWLFATFEISWKSWTGSSQLILHHHFQFLILLSQIPLQVIAILLEENFADSHQSDSSQRQSNFCVSESYNELGSVPYLEGGNAYEVLWVHPQRWKLVYCVEFNLLSLYPPQVAMHIVCISHRYTIIH